MERTWARAAAGTLSACLFAASFLMSPAGAAANCPAVTTVREWTTVKVPGLGGDTKIVDHDVAAAKPDVIFFTDGDSIVRSRDGGCSFKTVHEPASEGLLPGSSSSIVSLDVLDPTGVKVVALLVASAPTGGVQAVYSADGGDSWSPSTGLPPAGQPVYLEAGPAEAFALIDAGGGASLLFASDDGAVWNLRSDVSKLGVGTGLKGVTPDPIDPASLWAWGDSGLYHSTDAGASFRAIETFAGMQTGPVDVFHAPGKPAQVSAFLPGVEGMLRSNDGGETWFGFNSPGLVDSVDHGKDSEAMLATTAESAYVYHAPSFQWINIHPPGRPLTGVVADRTPQPRFFMRTDNTFEIFSGDAGLEIEILDPTPFIDVPLLETPPELEIRPPRLSPRSSRVVMSPGERRRVTYRLDIPKRPVPLDVYFLVDSTDSMDRLIEDLAHSFAGIVNETAGRGIHARFGLGELRGYPDRFPPREDEPNFVYRKRVDFHEGNQALKEGLDALVATAGGRYEGNLGALFQLATGLGQEIDPPGPMNDIPPGHDPKFSKNAVRVVIHGTNSEWFEPPEPGDPTQPNAGGSLTPPEVPTFEEAIEALNRKGIHHVGIAAGGSSNFRRIVSELSRVSRGTGTVAPPGGVDCNGDGKPDVRAGKPLVCGMRGLQEGQVVDAIVNLLEAVQTQTAASLRVAQGARAVQSLAPESYDSIVEQRTGKLTFTVTYRCTEALEGTRTPVRLDALLGGTVRDGVTAAVVCRGEDEPPTSPPLAALAPLAAGFAVPPPPPPPPAYEVGSATQTQAQSQAQAQAGMAMQEEQKPQLAAAHAAKEIEEAQELAFSAYQERPAPYGLYGAAAAMCLAYAGVMLRSRAAAAPQECRRRGRTY